MKQLHRETLPVNPDLFPAGHIKARSTVTLFIGRETVAGHAAPFYVSAVRNWTNNKGGKNSAAMQYTNKQTEAEALAVLAEYRAKYTKGEAA